MMKKILPNLIWLSIFSISMAFLETAVVIYLRELLYPGGFHFPLAPMPGRILATELIRELATLLMLAGAGYLAGKSFSTRFAWFLYSFAVWDIFYYVFLKLMINWPGSFMTWDVLFLLPTTWTGPVITPILVSMTMILFSLIILYYSASGHPTRILHYEWFLLIAGSLVLLISFTLEYSRYMLESFHMGELVRIPPDPKVHYKLFSFIPNDFPWVWFIAGEGILLSAIVYYARRIKRRV
jgi:hypothetical protein